MPAIFRRPPQYLRFFLERWIQRGALYLLLLVGAIIAGVAVTGGIVAYFVTDAFDTAAHAVWWAFLRLTDPGYLGDDEGTSLRVISTVITVAGYVLFMGSLIAIMTQWLNQELRKLESGLTPVGIADHILILGWTSRTASIVHELVLSEGRVRRFLLRRNARNKLRVAILAESVGSSLRQEIRELLGKHLRRVHIVLRSGSSLRVDHLERVNFTRAAAIILPGADYTLGGPDVTDTRIVKSLLTISSARERLDPDRPPPVVVAELFDADKAEIARRVYGGEVNIIAGDAFISRLIVQGIRHRGLSLVYAELLSYERGNEVYIQNEGELEGRPFASLLEMFPRAIPLGVIREENGELRTYLNPPADMPIEETDRVVVLAEDFDHCTPDVALAESTGGDRGVMAPVSTDLNPPRLQALRRVLLMGWSHKVEAILKELTAYSSERFEVDVLSIVPVAERVADLAHVDLAASNVLVKHLLLDFTRWSQLSSVDLASYDNIVILGSDWLDTSEETDARTILGYSAVAARLAESNRQPGLLVELIDPANHLLFRDSGSEVVVSPAILSHMLAHAALRHELTGVYAELFGPGGAEVFFRSVSDFGLAGVDADFRQVQRVVAGGGAIALGVRIRSTDDGALRRPVLNPGAARRWRFEPGDEIIVLTHYS